MKIKQFLTGLLICLSLSSSFASDGVAALIGIVIGTQLVQPRVYVQPAPVYVPYQPVYVQPPQVIYQSYQPVYITPSQAPYYDPVLHGYCAPYQDDMYANCLNNMRRKNYEDSVRRQYNGYSR